MAAVPQPILDYLDANRRLDGDAMLAAFAPDAVVVDDRVIYRGLREIHGWIQDAIAVQAVATLRLSAPVGAEQRVVVDVRGPFPASPVLTTLSFTLSDDHIARLEIGRRDSDPRTVASPRAGRLP